MFEEFNDAIFHRLWTKAVGTADYDKPQWMELEVLVHRGLNAIQRIELAKEALVLDGYFRDVEIGDDIAPRIIELTIHYRNECKRLKKMMGNMIDRIAKQSALLSKKPEKDSPEM